jgi:hypothetical protein
MNTKKMAFLLILTVLSSLVFAEVVSRKVEFDDEKLSITSTDLGDYYGSRYYHCKLIGMTNKTNYEMEVKISYVIYMQYDKTVTSKRDTEEKVTGKTFKLSPHWSGSVVVPPSLEGNGIANFVELINYRVIQKDYEIQSGSTSGSTSPQSSSRPQQSLTIPSWAQGTWYLSPESPTRTKCIQITSTQLHNIESGSSYDIVLIQGDTVIFAGSISIGKISPNQILLGFHAGTTEPKYFMLYK